MRYYCGYYSLNGDKVYYDLSSQGKYLITSGNTAFAIDYLYEVILLLLHGNVSFEALADVYNQLHNFNQDDLVSRNSLCRKRLTDGYFMYALLEMSERAGLDQDVICY